jgi:SAM-dependent methyltransferase
MTVLSMSTDPVIDAYSRHAHAYSSPQNQESCWGLSSRALWQRLAPRTSHTLLVDVGCGTGAALVDLARRVGAGVRLVGVEPALGLRERARATTQALSAIEIRAGRFEELPFAAASVDYVCSIMAFHWVTDPRLAARELARVLAPNGDVDLFFIGRWNGREFIRVTSPIFLRHMGPARLLDAVRLRQQLTAEQAADLFRETFPAYTVEVSEWYETHFDTLAGHWNWWVRIEGQLVTVPEARREQCELELQAALSTLAEPSGIPYTLHLLHVRIVGGAGRVGDDAADAP